MTPEDILKALEKKIQEYESGKLTGQLSLEMNIINGKIGDYTIATKVKTKS